MVKDARYTAVQSLITVGKIQKFSDIFKYIPKTIVARDLGLNYRSFVGKVNAPNRFGVLDILKLAEYIDCPPGKIFDLIVADIPTKKKKGQ